MKTIDMSKLTTESEVLYRAGLQFIKDKKDEDAEKENLYAACLDVDRLTALWAEIGNLYHAACAGKYPSPAWNKVQRVDKEILKLTQKLFANSRKYGWTPLTRSILRQRAAALSNLVDDANDPMKEIMDENIQRMRQSEQDSASTEHDPMEEVLGLHETE